MSFGGALAACGSSSGNASSGRGGGHSAGTSSAAGTSNAAAGSSAAGASSGAAQGGMPSGGAGGAGIAGAAGSVVQAGGGAFSGVAGGGGGGAGGTGGAAGTSGAAGSGGGTSTPALKFVVYLDDWTGSYTSWANKIDFSKMTHLNLAFYTATTDNDWNDASGQSDSDVKALVAKAHAAGVKVLVSLGGGGGDTTVVNQYDNPSNDDALVSNLDALLTRLNLDGADIDIEKESKAEVGENYAAFVSKVIAKLRPEGKLVTAAVAPYLQGYMNDDTLHSFDFVNIMTYSTNTGDYTSALDFYVGKNMDKTKLTLGIISECDQHTSVATTKSIIAIAKNYGGAMLWDLAEDAAGSASVYQSAQGSL